MGEHKNPGRTRVRVKLDGKDIGPFLTIARAKALEAWLHEAGDDLVNWMEGQVMARLVQEVESKKDALVVQVFRDDSTALVILKADLLTDTEEDIATRAREAAERILAERERLLERRVP